MNAGYTAGYADQTIGASKKITRQEAAVMIGRLLKLADDPSGANFSDSNEFADWSINVIGAVATTQIMKGYEDSSFKPAKPITRAEAVVSLDRAVTFKDATFGLSGLYGPETGSKTIDSDVTINAADVTLQNTVINGNLIFSDKIGEGDAGLKNVIVKGTTTISGGGVNSIHLNNASLESVVVNKTTGPVRIVAEGSSRISSTVVQSSVALEEDASLKGAGFQTVKLEGTGADSTVSLKGAFDKVTVAGAKIAVTIPSGIVQVMDVSDQSSDSTLNISANVIINLLKLNSPVKVTGQGTIQTANISDAAIDSSFEKPPTIRKDINGVIIKPLAPPTFVSVIATNTGSNVGLGVGDSIVITFDQNTNKPAISAANLNLWFKLSSGHSFGTSLINSDINWNSTGNILTISLTNITGTTFVVGDTISVQAAAGLKNSAGSSAASIATSLASTGSFNSSPLISNVAAANTGNNIGLGIGDSVSITFNQNTNRPSIKAANLNTMLILSNGHSFGTALLDRDMQWNATGNILTITFSNITGNTFNEGDTVTVAQAANIRDSNNVTEPSTAVSAASIGSFTTFLEVKSVIATNAGINKGLGIGDTVVITFSTATNQPAMTAANFKKWFIPTSGHSFGTNLSDGNITWTSSVTLTVRFTDITGVTFAVGDAITINIASNIRDSASKLPQNFIFTPQCTGSFSQAPAIVSVVAINTGNNEGKLAGDSVIITFDQNTSKPYIPASTLNSLLILSGSHSFGTNLSNNDIVWNAAGNVLTITFSNITGNTFVVGDKITISKTANIRDYAYLTEESVAVSPVSTGSFSPLPITPAVVSVVASNTGKAIGLNNGDSISIQFSRDTNRPVISPTNLNKWFILNGADFGSSAINWTANNILTITFSSLPSDPSKYIKIGDTIQISADANIRDTTGTSVAYSGNTVPLTGSFSTAPAITSLKAIHTGNNIGLSYGDTLEISFDKATNAPEINAENLKNWFAISNSHSFGSALSDNDAVWNETGKILTITFSNVTGSTIAFGDTIHVTAAANIMDATGEIKVSDALSPVCIGSFTTAPKIINFYVDNASGVYDSELGAGDNINIVFDQLTNKPAVTASQINDWFLFKNDSDKSMRRFVDANISSVNWTTVDGEDHLNIVLQSKIDPSKTSIVVGDTYIDFKTSPSSIIKDITSSVQGEQRTEVDGIPILSGNY